ncbi:MAG: hypothetical protein GQ583_04690 [Methyloprofundus sp.]|nr:hypothetical protein [Methyloprofundus sp.]
MSYAGRILCGTIPAANPANPQIPPAKPFGPEGLYVPGTYISQFNMFNPHNIDIDLDTRISLTDGSIFDLIIPISAQSFGVVSCIQLLNQTFNGSNPLEERQVSFKSPMQLNVLLTDTVINSTTTVSEKDPSQPKGVSGERGLVLSCFYECKPGATPETWSEVTSLMLANQSNRLISTKIAFFNGNHNMIAQTNLLLPGRDLDELNVCRTLHAGGIPVPLAGLIEVLLFDPTGNEVGGVYGWMKNFLGKFFLTVNEPFQGRVTGVGKTECRLAPPEVTTRAEIEEEIVAKKPPVITPILIQNTAD